MSDSVTKKQTVNDFTIILEPGNRLDNNNAHFMVDTIGQAQSDGYTYILIDMTELEFISSAGVGAILGTIETSRENGGDIIIYKASENILRALQALDLLDYLTIKDTREAALELAVK